MRAVVQNDSDNLMTDIVQIVVTTSGTRRHKIEFEGPERLMHIPCCRREMMDNSNSNIINTLYYESHQADELGVGILFGSGCKQMNKLQNYTLNCH